MRYDRIEGAAAEQLIRSMIEVVQSGQEAVFIEPR